ncbi:MAG: hypothetical protein ACI4MH_04480 [Candidatus Coproplasma sp.]
MKAQMKFQKLLSLLTLIVVAVVFVYALSFNSGNMSALVGYYLSDKSGYDVADTVVNSGQTFVSLMIVLCIVLFVAIAILYITCSNSRRNYYITNYISVGLIIGLTGAVALVGLIFVTVIMAQFYAMDWDFIYEIYEMEQSIGAPEVNQSPIIFILGYIVFLALLADCLAWVYNLIWKIKLMKGEKALLEQGLVKEVA